MFDLRTILLALIAACLLGSLGSWYLTGKYKDTKWTAAIKQQQVDAAKQLQAAMERAITAERRQTEFSNQLEVKHVESERKLDAALVVNRRLARELGGLRDPGRRPSCGGTVSEATDTTGQPASGSTGAELSAEASEFLFEFARDADRAAQYAQTCSFWIRQIGREVTGTMQE